MDPKTLTESGWKAIISKFKLTDKDLQKALSAYETLDDGDFDMRLKALGKISALASTVKKNKEVTSIADAVKYLTQMAAAADAEEREVTKAKGLAQKKVDVDAKKREKEEKGGAEEDEEEEGDALKKLTTALKTLKLSKKPYYFLVCDAKPYGLIVSKKDIRKGAQAKKELSQIAGGSTRPPKFGECHFEGSKLVFDMEKPPGGLARILQKWIKENTGLGLKVMVGTESAEDEDQPAEGRAETAAPSSAKPARAGGAANEKAASLHKAAETWHGMRKVVDAKVTELKKAIQAHYADRHPDLLKDIDKNLVKLDGVLDKLDHRLAESLTNAGAAANEAARQAELKKSKAILTEYIGYVKSEPLIAHMDSNPFGVKTNLKQTLVEAVTHAAKHIG